MKPEESQFRKDILEHITKWYNKLAPFTDRAQEIKEIRSDMTAVLFAIVNTLTKEGEM